MSSDICARLGTRVRELRKARGWTQAEMAERVGIDRSYLVEVEQGKVEICLRNLDLVAQVFRMELPELLTFSTKGR